MHIWCQHYSCMDLAIGMMAQRTWNHSNRWFCWRHRCSCLPVTRKAICWPLTQLRRPTAGQQCCHPCSHSGRCNAQSHGMQHVWTPRDTRLPLVAHAWHVPPSSGWLVNHDHGTRQRESEIIRSACWSLCNVRMSDSLRCGKFTCHQPTIN